jgi:hypothetical protein
MPIAGVGATAGLRLAAGLRLCRDDAVVWIVGERLDASVRRALLALPHGELFEVGADGACRVPGRRLPAARLPQGPWTPLSANHEIEPGVPALPAERPAAARLHVVRDGGERVANVLVTSLQAFHAWVGTAAYVRLQPLRFVANTQGAVLVHGLPLPSLPGDVAVEESGIVVPAGHRLEPDVPRQLVAAALHLDPGDLAVFTVEGSCTFVRKAAFVPASRSAVRATRKRIGHD